MDAHFKIEPEGITVILDELGMKTDLDLHGSSEFGERPDYYSPLGKRVDYIYVPFSENEAEIPNCSGNFRKNSMNSVLRTN